MVQSDNATEPRVCLKEPLLVRAQLLYDVVLDPGEVGREGWRALVAAGAALMVRAEDAGHEDEALVGVELGPDDLEGGLDLGHLEVAPLPGVVEVKAKEVEGWRDEGPSVALRAGPVIGIDRADPRAQRRAQLGGQRGVRGLPTPSTLLSGLNTVHERRPRTPWWPAR